MAASEWTVETLKVYLDQRFIDEEKAVRAALAAAEKAVEKAEANAEKWRENANEWRAAMMDREARFASRVEIDSELRSFRSEVNGLKESRAGGVGHTAGSQSMWGYVVGAVGFAVGIATLIGLVVKGLG